MRWEIVWTACRNDHVTKNDDFTPSQQTKMDWNELKILIHFNSFEQNIDWINSIYIISILRHGLK